MNEPNDPTVYDWIATWLPDYLNANYGITDYQVSDAPAGYSQPLGDLPGTLKITQAWIAADTWLRQALNQKRIPATGLFITGPTGTGKTSVLAALWYSLPAITYRPERHWWPARRLAEYLRAPDASPGHRVYLRRALITPELLAIDDLGAEPATDWDRELIQAVIEERHDAGRCTMGTTNLSEADLTARYGQRTIDRLLSRARLVPQVGGSHRGRA